MEGACFRGSATPHCICTNASRGLSAIAEFLVYFHISCCICIFANELHNYRSRPIACGPTHGACRPTRWLTARSLERTTQAMRGACTSLFTKDSSYFLSSCARYCLDCFLKIYSPLFLLHFTFIRADVELQAYVDILLHHNRYVV